MTSSSTEEPVVRGIIYFFPDSAYSRKLPVPAFNFLLVFDLPFLLCMTDSGNIQHDDVSIFYHMISLVSSVI